MIGINAARCARVVALHEINAKDPSMSHTPHELHEEFPQHVDAMHRLKESDAHFAKLFDDYHTINRAVHRAETDVEPTDDIHMAQMRKERIALKDAISAALSAA
ncbi:MAG: hypothetical protein ACJAVT_001015 [Yoonia sp.]